METALVYRDSERLNIEPGLDGQQLAEQLGSLGGRPREMPQWPLPPPKIGSLNLRDYCNSEPSLEAASDLHQQIECVQPDGLVDEYARDDVELGRTLPNGPGITALIEVARYMAA